MNKIEECYISTGQKQVLHTLWVHRHSLFGQDFFIKNLSADKDKAVAEAKQYAKRHNMDFGGVFNSPRFKRAEHFEKYGITFKHKRKKGKSYYQGFATPEFWDAWKENKEQIKKEGFYVSKYPDLTDRERKRMLWYVFYKPDKEESK